jgi:hypothetical protein
MDDYKQKDNRRLILGSVLIAIVLCVFVALIAVAVSKLSSDQNGKPQAAKLGIVPYIPPTATAEMTQTPTEPAAEVVDGIQKGNVVQIFGTDGAGLKLRTDPGIESAQKFIALDSEVYEVTDGPVRTDAYVWWHLTSPYDPDRSGWAVSKYLTRIQ